MALINNRHIGESCAAEIPACPLRPRRPILPMRTLIESLKGFGRGRTGGRPPILPFETGLATFTASGYWVVGPLG